MMAKLAKWQVSARGGTLKQAAVGGSGRMLEALVRAGQRRITCHKALGEVQHHRGACWSSTTCSRSSWSCRSLKRSSSLARHRSEVSCVSGCGVASAGTRLRPHPPGGLHGGCTPRLLRGPTAGPRQSRLLRDRCPSHCSPSRSTGGCRFRAVNCLREGTEAGVSLTPDPR